MILLEVDISRAIIQLDNSAKMMSPFQSYVVCWSKGGEWGSEGFLRELWCVAKMQ